MKLLLDTHILVWAFTDDFRLGKKAQDLINTNRDDLLCSAAAIWEISVKHSHDPYGFDITAERMIQLCEENEVHQLPVYFRHIPALGSFQRFENAPVHKDPFDRIMIAQAKADNMFFLTHDSLMKYYDEPCILYV